MLPILQNLVEDAIGTVDAEPSKLNAGGLSSPDVSFMSLVTPLATQSLTVGLDQLTGTAGADTFQGFRSDFTQSDKIDGGDGIDTLQLLNDPNTTPYFRIDLFAEFKGVEIISGTTRSDTIDITATQLVGVTTIIGNGGTDYVRTTGSADFTGKTLTGISTIQVMDSGSTITVGDASTALLLHTFNRDNGLVLMTGVLSDAQRTTLYAQGIDTITARSDVSGPVITTHAPVPA